MVWLASNVLIGPTTILPDLKPVKIQASAKPCSPNSAKILIFKAGVAFNTASTYGSLARFSKFAGKVASAHAAPMLLNNAYANMAFFMLSPFNRRFWLKKRPVNHKYSLQAASMCEFNLAQP